MFDRVNLLFLLSLTATSLIIIIIIFVNWSHFYQKQHSSIVNIPRPLNLSFEYCFQKSK